MKNQYSIIRSVEVALILIVFTIKLPLESADILYVTTTDNTIICYDTTGYDGNAIANTKSVFANTNLFNPQAIGFDTVGNFYASNSNNTISKFNQSGIFQSSISANLNGPLGLAFDFSNNLYVANYNGNNISKYDSFGNYLANVNSNGPSALSFDSTGKLYVANSVGSTLSIFNTSGVFQLVNTLGGFHLDNPLGIAFDSKGNIYVSNFGHGPPSIAKNTVSKFNSAGIYLGNLSSGLINPLGIAIDSMDNIYVVNKGNTISKFDSSGGYLTSWTTGSSYSDHITFKPFVVPECSTVIMSIITLGLIAYLVQRGKWYIKGAC